MSDILARPRISAVTAPPAPRYLARFAAGPADIAACQNLRARAFFGAGASQRRDQDGYDALCRHVLILPHGGDAPVASFRLFGPSRGEEVAQSYSAQFYDLAPLAGFAGPMLELGRFCTDPREHDPDILRMAWAALTRIVDDEGIALLYGCASFEGAEPERHADALALLGARHVGPVQWRCQRRAPEALMLDSLPCGGDPARGLRRMPQLLRFYLSMGGWVGDHAVIDRQMDTLHVFTALEIGRIPAPRARALRALAGQGIDLAHGAG